MQFIQYIDEDMVPLLAKRGIAPVRFSFCSLNEFLRHPYIQYFIKDKNFDEFVICRGAEFELISKLKSGKHYKIGVLDGNMSEIPEWCGQKVIVTTKPFVIP